MFKSRYLTVRVRPAKGGFLFFPNVGDCTDDGTGCICTDGCTNCSGDCTGCTATCRGADSTGAILVDREGEVEITMDIKGLQAVLKKVGAVNDIRAVAKSKGSKPAKSK